VTKLLHVEQLESSLMRLTSQQMPWTVVLSDETVIWDLISQADIAANYY